MWMYLLQAEDGIRDAHEGLEFRRVLFRSDPGAWILRAHLIRDGVHQMRLAEPGLAMEEKGIEGDLAAFREGAGGVVGQFIGLADHIIVEGVAALDHAADRLFPDGGQGRSEEHTSELQSLMRTSYAVF